MSNNELAATIKELTAKGKGILAADESAPTIAKRLESVHVESNEDNRRAYREMLFTTTGLNEFISGVILYEETLNQKASNGQLFPELLKKNGIVPGIKVDKGLINLPFSDEKVTQGLDGLAERLVSYKKSGTRFAKWRAVYSITDILPGAQAIKTNAECLARYAAICQEQGIVPIVEPEVLIDGRHSIERCAVVSEQVLHAVFHALNRHHVQLEHMILKPSMVIAGKECASRSTAQQVAQATLQILRRTVPAAVPSINFLSGGQEDVQATCNLQAMNAQQPQPWLLSFSYARALQNPCLNTWQGKTANVKAAQEIFQQRAKLNSLAVLGKYAESMENKSHVTQ